MSAYVRACHEAATATGLDVRPLGTIDEWKTRWTAALEGNVQAASPLKEFINTTGLTTRIDEPTVAVERFVSLNENSRRFDAERPTMIADPNSATASIAPVLQRLEDKVSKRAQSLPSQTGLLVVTNGATIGTSFQIEHNLTTIGRNPANDIWLNDPTVSRSHALIYRYGNKFFVEDLDSSNGTFLHQTRIIEKSALSPYDELCIGVFIFLFMQGRATQDETTSRVPVRRGPLLPHSRLEEDIEADTERFRAFAARQDEDWSSGYSDDYGWRSRIRWPRRRHSD
ncbi:FHA domain-containing protein [Trebonia sp.]|uniref:FHA domain-containing protein n=1 Tax=Trebonia sp. TaxID=2767075 RepID=UPI002627DC90|nr:FHA domain-containing protein [Trebonia sp.]